jgi:hypothetical protein
MSVDTGSSCGDVLKQLPKFRDRFGGGPWPHLFRVTPAPVTCIEPAGMLPFLAADMAM